MHQKDDDVRSSGKDDVGPDSIILAPATPKEGDGKQQALREKLSSDIAIIGISGRFAGSPNLEAFWDHLQAGRSCIEEIKREGWEVSIHSDPDLERSYPSQVKWGGILQGIDLFDPLFFNISPLEAARMDPQQRLFLEEAYKAFEDAGYSAEQLSEKKVGVFVGARPSDYKELRKNVGAVQTCGARHGVGARHDPDGACPRPPEEMDAHLFLGNDMAVLAARISYFLNCKGPSLTVDTASSSSLVAIHLACESIRTGESEMALAGGVFVMSSPEYATMAAKTQMLSPDGRCKTFDKSANGTVIGEGVGTLVLKPLEAAIADGDHLYGVIKGSSINQDGRTKGMTAPSLLAQKALLSEVYKKAAINPETVSYIEAHGTGSKLGDPIEAQALTEAFRLFTEKKQFCVIGSHKPNIGHTINAAGIAGILKILLAMKYQQIPPTINVEEVNPQIDFQNSPFFLNTELKEWKSPDGSPRRAGVSSFGLSGTNCHVILEEAPPQKQIAHGQARSSFFFPFSAKTKASLTQKVEDMVNWLEKEGETYAIENISYTLVQGRSHFVMRSAVVAKDTHDLLHALRAIISKGGSEHEIDKAKGQDRKSLFSPYENWPLQELLDNDFYAPEEYKQKLEVLADLYVKGYNLAWDTLFKKGRYHRVPLPTYPFFKESYWITKSTMHERYSVGAEGGGNGPCPCGEVDRLPGQGQATAPTDSQILTSERDDPPTPFGEILTDRLHEMLSHMVSDLLKVRVEDINAKTELSEYGFDSITFTEFANRLNQTYQLDLTPAHFFEYSTIERLAQYLHATYASILAAYFAAVSPVNTSGDIPDTSARKGREGASPSSTQRSVDAGEGLKSRGVDGGLTLSPDWGQPNPSLRGSVTAAIPIAIIGMSGCFPQAPDVQSLWNNLLEGKDCISEIPFSRWDWQSYFGNRATSNPNKTNVKWGGIVEDVELFDPLFFGISPSEAEQMDPQQRLLMMYIWKAIEDAGYAASSLSGSKTALFVGTTSSGYSERISRANIAIEGYSSTGMTPSVGPNRMSYFLNLHGPSEAIETACSSSLVAIHRGVSAIESGQCTMAIVGGINTLVSPELHISYSKAGMLSEDGRCKSFSAQANGYVRSEGIGILVLKKLTDAEQADDHIYGVIRGSAENHGGRASSLTAPNPRAQADLLSAAYRKAEIDPRTVGYIEAHGTGTPLGDPIEINGLKTAFNELAQTIGEGPMLEATCGVGSVKSNIGHLELAAGVTGVIKVLLQLQHKKLVKSLHCEQLNPYLQLESSPFYIVQENREWEAMCDREGNILPRRAGVSSFGFGGANAHVVIEEYVPEGTSDGKGQYCPNNETTQPGHAIHQGRRKAPSAPPGTPDPYGWVPPLPRDDEGGRATGTCGGTVGVGGVADVGRGPCADPGSPSTPYFSGIARKVRDISKYPSSTHLSGQSSEPLGLAPPLLIVLSAKNEERLHEQVQQLLAWVQARMYTEERPRQANDQSEAPGWHQAPDRDRPYPPLQSLAYTLQVGREAMEERLALQVSSLAELAEKLQRYLQEPQEKGHWYRGQVRRHKAALFGADEEVEEALQEAVNKWIQRGKYEKLLEWWVKGLRIEWQHLYGEHLPQRISLPTYPFAREHYWISIGASSGPAVACGLAPQVCPIPTGGQTERLTATTVSSLPVLHPLVQHNISTLWNQQFSSTFRGNEFFLADHVIREERIMPAVAYLEMARAAVREAIGADTMPEDSHLHLSHVVWARPLVVGELPITVHIALEPQDNGTITFVISREGTQGPDIVPTKEETTAQIHCQGQAVFRTQRAFPNVDLPAVQARCQRQISTASCYDRFRELGFSYGPAMQGIEQLSVGDGEILARLRLPVGVVQTCGAVACVQTCGARHTGYSATGLHTGYSADPGAQMHVEGERRDVGNPHPYVLHPSVLDAALQACIGLLMEQNTHEDAHLPFALEELSIVSETPTQGWAWVHQRSTSERSHSPPSVFDIEICDDEGRVAVVLRGLSTRELPGSFGLTPKYVLLTPIWQEVTGGGLPHLHSPLEETPLTVPSLVLLCELPSILASRIQDQMTSGGHCRSLVSVPSSGSRKDMDSSRLPTGKVHTPNPNELSGNALGSAQLRRGQRFQDLVMQLIQQLQHLLRSRPAGSVLVQVVMVHREEPSLLDALSGVLKTAQQEYPRLAGQLIEVEGEPEEGELLAHLRENQKWPYEPHIRYRDGKRWVQEWQVHQEVSTPTNIPWKEGGCYLITGGAGGLARLFVQEIARHVETAAIILVGRSALSQEQRVQLETTGKSHIHIVYQQVDVTDGPAVYSLIQRVQAMSGHLDGIIHAAGVLRDSLLLNKTPEEVQAVLTSKVIGVELLDEASSQIPLDFFLLCSSANAVMGNVGQADYAAANAYLDAFAHARQALVRAGQRHGTTVSINWPLWEEGGMHVEADTRQMMRTRMGIEPLGTETGIRTLYQALASGLAQVMVAHGQVERIKQQLLPRPVSPIEAFPAKSITEEEQQVATTIGEEALRERASAYFKKQLAAVIKLPVQQIEATAPLEDYGFDSIMAIRFTNVLEDSFGPLSKTLLFEYPTLHSVTEYFLRSYPKQLRSVLRVEGISTGPGVGTKYRTGASPMSPYEATATPQIIAEDLEDSHPHRRLALLRKGTMETRESSIPFPPDMPIADGHAQQDKANKTDNIAIVGIAGRYPQARDLRAFWENLRQGRDCITEIPPERWDYRLSFNADKNKPGTTHCHWGGFLDGVDEFDPLFFNIAPSEAERMDPQERLFLECVYATLEDAGYPPSRGPRSYESMPQSNGLTDNVGVFVGVMYEEYQLFGAQAQVQGQPIAVAGNPSWIANRVSYFCNFHGPSLAVDTLCSSSLTAIHLACQSIQNGDCELAIAGGVNVSIHPNKYLFLEQGQFVSSGGHCQSFGVGADGYVPGEGVGAILLKPLAQAEADGDHIYGVIKATAINHGGKTNGFTVPNPQAQAEVIGQALKKAGIDPRTISYVEAHGTGTVLGDPIEIAGLTRVFAAASARMSEEPRTESEQGQALSTATGWCAIGSVKSNIGHAESAAGIAGVTKVLLQMRYGQLVPSLHAEILNPHIDFSTTPFVVQRELGEWKRPQVPGTGERKGREADGACPRRAGISSFGAGGSNAHVILEEYVGNRGYRAYPDGKARPDKGFKSVGVETIPAAPTQPALVVLSARTDERLHKRVEHLLSWIQDRSQWATYSAEEPVEQAQDESEALDRRKARSLQDLAYTLQVGREAMEERLAFQVGSLQELEEKLQQYREGQHEGGDWYRGRVKQHDPMGTFATDEDGQKTVLAWMSKGKYEKLLEWWVKGLMIDWKHLYTVGAGSAQGTIPTAPALPRRISLPTYPFARERYWIPIETFGTRRSSDSAPVAQGTGSAQDTTPTALHPLVQRNTSTLWEQRFSSIFRGDEFFLTDHVIKGENIMPAVAYLEMACVAVREAIGVDATTLPSHIQLNHVVWARPLACDPAHPVTIHTTLELQENGTITFVISRDAVDSGQKPRVGASPTPTFPPVLQEEETRELALLCQGRALVGQSHEPQSTTGLIASQNLDLPAIQARCQHQVSATMCYQRYHKMGMSYGPTLQGIEHLSIGEDEVLARLRLPVASGTQTDTEFVLHPGMLDAALQACILMEQNTLQNAHLPFTLEELSIVSKIPTQGWAWVRRKREGTRTGAVGTGLAPVRIPSRVPKAPVHVPPSVFDIQVCDDEGRVAVLLSGLSIRELPTQSDQAQTMLLTPSWKEEMVGKPSYPYSPSEEAPLSAIGPSLVLLCGLPGILALHIQDQMASGGRCRSLPVGTQTGTSPVPTAPIRQLHRGQHFQDVVLQLIQQLQHLLRSRPAGSVLVQVVVAHREEPSLLDALSGVLKTAQQEYPRLAGQLIEVEGEPEEGELLAYLRENQKWPHEPHIRYRDGKRWVREWQEYKEVSTPTNIPWKEGGCYLITGGAGGLAQLFVQDIARQVQEATIILVGRSALSDELRAQLAPQAENSGVHIDYQQVDVTDGPAVRALIERAQANSGHLDGIIYAAGVLRDSLLLNKTPEEVQAVLVPKVIGVELLDEASSQIPLDFFLLCSSVTAVMGNVGQADYAGANAYLDAFAHARQALVRAGQRHGTTVSINWPLWEDGGMHVEADTRQMMRTRMGIEPLGTETGIRTLYQALASGLAQVMVAHGQVEHIKQQLLSRTEPGVDAVPIESATHQSRRDRALHLSGDKPQSQQISRDKLCEALAHMISRVLKVRVEEIDAETPLPEYGFDSVSFVQLANRLNQTYQLDLTPTLFFEHSTLERLAQHLQGNYPAILAPHFAEASGTTSELVPANPLGEPEKRPATSPLPRRRTRLAQQSIQESVPPPSPRTEPIAIIGISGCFPQSPDLQSLWSNLLAGRDCMSEMPQERWDWQSYFGDTATSQVKWAGVIEEAELFDPLFFGISPREAEQMDPQQRLLMMYVWKAIEDAGYAAESLSGSDTALFVGTMNSGYSERVSRARMSIEGYSSTSQVGSVGPNRMSYFLNLHGPSEPIETACSSSLVAIHRGANAIESGQCSMAIVGGVNTLVSPELHISFSKAGMLSSDGRCKPFSAQANGYVRGEGVGMLVLKKLSDAERDGDHIYGVIRASAENHGGRATSLTAPNPRAQADVLIAAYRKAGIDPRTVGYIEAHGTGTELGDPIEINGLKMAWSELTQGTGTSSSPSENGPMPVAPCGIGSVKSNIGHLELAAGVAGVIKVLLQMQHKTLVKSLHCEQINPYIQLEDSPFYIVQENRKWEALRDRVGNVWPRRAGVSSFGFGGTNAHVVLEEYVPKPRATLPGSSAQPPALIVLSARTEEQMREQARQLLAWIAVETGSYHTHPHSFAPMGPDLDQMLQDLAYTLQVGRSSMEERLALQVSSLAELEKQLQTYVSDSAHEQGNWYRGQVKQHDVIGAFAADEDGQKAITAWMNKRKYGKLLDLWVKGLTIDWKHLYTVGTESLPSPGSEQGGEQGPARPRRISLPTYPFARERYWIPATTVETGQGRPVVRSRPVAQGTQATTTDKANGNGNAPNKSHRVALSDLSTETVGTAPSASPMVTDMQMASSVANGRGKAPTIQARQIEEELARSLAKALYLEEGNIDVEIPFGDMGLDSVIGVEWIQSINKLYASNLAMRCVYDYPTIRQLASFLAEDLLKHRHTTVQSEPTLSLDDLLQQVQQGTLNAKEADLLLISALALDSYLIQAEHGTSQKEDCR